MDDILIKCLGNLKLLKFIRKKIEGEADGTRARRASQKSWKGFTQNTLKSYFRTI